MEKPMADSYGARDIVLVTIDSLRADVVGFAPDDRDRPVSIGRAETPSLDTLAAEATVADVGVAPSTHTRASIPAILTSRPAHWFFTEFLGDIDVTTIGERLSEQGYATAAFHSNPLLSRYFGYAEGFERFHDGLRVGGSSSWPESLVRTYSKVERFLQRYPYTPAGPITDRAVDWLASSNGPRFLWVHYMDPHGPYTLDRSGGIRDKIASERLWQRLVRRPDEVSDEDRDRALAAYRREIEYTDRHLERLFTAIDERCRNPAVAVTADHGEEFDDHGAYSHHPKLYEELIAVPLILNLPEADSPDDSNQPIGLVDVTPTLLDAVGLSPDKSNAGVPVQSLLRGEVDRSWVTSSTNPDDGIRVAVRGTRYKLVGGRGDDRVLYDLDVDPGEHEDRYGEVEDARVTALEEALESSLAMHTDEGDKLDDLDDVVEDRIRDQLHDLGYLE